MLPSRNVRVASQLVERHILTHLFAIGAVASAKKCKKSDCSGPGTMRESHWNALNCNLTWLNYSEYSEIFAGVLYNLYTCHCMIQPAPKFAWSVCTATLPRTLSRAAASMGSRPPTCTARCVSLCHMDVECCRFLFVLLQAWLEMKTRKNF